MSYHRPHHGSYPDDPHHYAPVAFPQDLPYSEDYSAYSQAYPIMNPYAQGGDPYAPRRGDYRSLDYDDGMESFACACEF